MLLGFWRLILISGTWLLERSSLLGDEFRYWPGKSQGNLADTGLISAAKSKKDAKSVCDGPVPYGSEQRIFCRLAEN